MRADSLRRRTEPPSRCSSSATVLQRGGRASLDGGEAEFPGGGQCLIEEFPGAIEIAGPPAGDEHSAPFKAGPGPPGGGPRAGGPARRPPGRGLRLVGTGPAGWGRGPREGGGRVRGEG